LQQGIFLEEEHKYDLAVGMFAQATGMVGPSIIVHGTEEQKKEFLPSILRGEQVWCQLFSEPNAGSDLAALRTKAELDGDEWVISGQKVWTSSAHVADWGMLLARTDWDAPKHRGITYFLLDMRSPGIEVRPLVQATGGAEFNEVFLEEVRIPKENVLGEVNGGWAVAMTTLTSERADIGAGHGDGFGGVLRLAQQYGRVNDPVVRQELMKLYTSYQISKYIGFRTRTAASKGIAPGPEVSTMKIAISDRLAFQGDLVESLMGADGMLWGADAIDDGYWQTMVFMGQWMARIGGGGLLAISGVDFDDADIASNAWVNSQLAYNGETSNGASWGVTFAIQNLFNRNPPVIPSFSSRGGSQSVSDAYDAEGRRYNLSVNYSF
jgi:alkylation response protein AidB-like acyl-CoA dehydrogenase